MGGTGAEAGLPGVPRRLAQAAVICAVTLLLVELGLRAFLLYQFSKSTLSTPRSPGLEVVNRFDHQNAWPWRLRENMRAVRVVESPIPGDQPFPPQHFSVSTNAMGLRVVPNQPEHPRRRVLALGDSTTFGLGSDDAEAWPALLQARLQERATGEWVVHNAGVTGYGVMQCLLRLRELAPALRPDTVVLTAGSNVATPALMVDARVHDLCASLTRVAGRPTSWILFRDALLPLLTQPPAARPPRVSLPEFGDALRAMHAFCREQGIQLVLLRWPWRDQTDRARNGGAVGDNWPQLAYQQALLDFGAQPGVSVVDLLPHFAAHPEELFYDAVHVLPPGNRIVADAVAAALHRAPAAEAAAP